jgi:1-acyl-sn-glycerol-3-phosphate acyltransferase
VNTGALQALTAINLDDLIHAFGLSREGLPARLVHRLFHEAARGFARQMLDFDAAIGERGLGEAACLTERLYVRDVRLYGADCLPDEPSLFVSNHPGLTDTLALFAALARPGLRTIALDRPFLLSLPNLSQQLFFLGEAPGERIALVRRVHRHLQAGGSLLTFPAGHTEPDPDVHDGAVESLARWTDSAGAFVWLRPETPVVPLCVRSVTWDVTTNNPLVRSRRTQDDRQLLASAFQLLANVMLHARPVTVKIQVGEPIRLGQAGGRRSADIHRAVLRSMRSLIESAPQGAGMGVL